MHTQIFVFGILLLVLTSTGSVAFAQTDDAASTLEGTVNIGALLPLSGDASAHGADVAVGVELAEANFNAYLQERGIEWILDVVVEDTMTSPVLAQEKLASLKAKGVNAVVGTYSSAELLNIKGYADNNNMLLISFGSTAPSLAIPDDSIYRFVPDDTRQSPALARLILDSGVTNVVPIWRGDAWGDGLIAATRASLADKGGVMAEGVRYNPEAAEFSVEVSLLSEQVGSYIDEVGADKVAVLIISFSEIINIAQSASQYENLAEIAWVGTDAVVKAHVLVDDPIANELFTTTGFVATQFAPAQSPVYEGVSSTIVGQIGREPVIYAFSAYDAVWTIGLSILAADAADTDSIIAAMPAVLEDYEASLGSIVLNDAGDLDRSNYEIWRLGETEWTLGSIYVPDTDSIVMVDMDDDTGDVMDDVTSTLEGTVNIGALLPLSGDASAHGADIAVGVELAEANFNAYLQERGIEWILDVVVEDTMTSPVLAQEKLASLKAKGVNAVVGTYSSAELLNIKGYADNNNMLLISFGSTAPSLAIPDDSIYRFVPDDTRQGPALARLILDSGVTNVVPIWRGDAWGDGLIAATRASLADKGGVVAEGVRYNPEAAEFSVEVSLLSEQVGSYIDEVGADKVAVLIISFSEIINIAQSASQYENLAEIAWVGTDAVVKAHVLVDDPIANELFTTTGFVATQFAPAQSPVYEGVSSTIVGQIGREPVIYAFSAYDAVWAIGLSILAADATDTDSIIAAMPAVLEDYKASLGSIVLNDAGDLDRSNYEIWRLGETEWTLGSIYVPDTDSIVMVDMDDDTGDVMDDVPTDDGEAPPPSGCLIATAAYGSELAPQVQFLREIRDGALLQTAAGTSFMTTFNQFYYSFSPAVADLERESPIFRDAVRTAITPAVYTLNIMTFADSEASVLAFGIATIAAIAGIYVIGPSLAVYAVAKRIRR